MEISCKLFTLYNKTTETFRKEIHVVSSAAPLKCFNRYDGKSLLKTFAWRGEVWRGDRVTDGQRVPLNCPAGKSATNWSCSDGDGRRMQDNCGDHEDGFASCRPSQSAGEEWQQSIVSLRRRRLRSFLFCRKLSLFGVMSTWSEGVSCRSDAWLLESDGFL